MKPKSISVSMLSMLLAAVLFMLPACASSTEVPAPDSSGVSSQTEEQSVPRRGDAITPTDYANEDNWMYVTEANLPVDVFLLYPTAYSAGEDGAPVGTVDDEGMRAVAQEFVQSKGSAFETAGNLFAPYYRQLDAVFTLSQTPEDVEEYIGGVPATDALAAFEYYIEHYNQGRPFILVSHSQGSSVTKELLLTYFKDNEEVYQRMVAAYVIGYSVTQEELDANPHLRFAEGPDDTGVIISYNTVSPEFEGNLTTLLPGAVAINPVSWTRESTPAPAAQSLGAFIDSGSGYEKVEGFADATLDPSRGTVICSTADEERYAMPSEASAIFGLGSFHGNDISLYYYDLRANAENRVQRFLEAQ